VYDSMNESLTGANVGPYELHDQIGQGGMATVYRGFQPSLGRPVAIKMLSLAQLPDPTLPERFRREAQLAASLEHPCIVPVYDFGEWGNYLYIVMRLVPGGTLDDRMGRHMPVQAIVQLVSQVADGLGYAHGQGIVHRDVKPTNVLLAGADWAMLGDFGIARTLGGMTRLTAKFGAIGTPAYMAPEQWIGGDIDGRADIYSLGIMLYQLLAGTVPFTAPTSEGLMRQHLEMVVPPLTTHRRDLPAGFEAVIQTALAKDPERRFRRTGEFKAALTVAGQPVPVTGFHLPTSVTPPVGPTTAPDLGPTMQVPIQSPYGTSVARPSSSSWQSSVLIGLVIALTVLLASAVGYIVAGVRLPANDTPTPTVTVSSVASQPMIVAPTAAPAVPTPTTPPAQVTQPAPPPPAQSALQPTPATSETPPPPTAAPTATMAPPPPTTAPLPPKPTVAQQTAPASPQAMAKPPTDQRLALVERHIGDYFAALNASDYARAQASCCTPAWRARYPLDEWRRNFAGVTDLRFATPIRYTTVEPNRIVTEVDYSFVNSSGTRLYRMLRMTFVPVGNDWLAAESVALLQN
jgi:serine/threonine protein kinase